MEKKGTSSNAFSTYSQREKGKEKGCTDVFNHERGLPDSGI